MQIDFEEGHRLYTYIGHHFAAGVGILVHQRHVPNIIRHQPVSDRLLEVDIRIGERVFAFIAVYMPHAGYHIDILNSTYDLLMKTSTAATRRGHSLVIGGDFNAQPGVGIRGWNLVNFEAAFDLNIANAHKNAEEDDMWTFRGILGALRRIDFILVPDNYLVSAAHASSDIDLGSDHRSVLTSFKTSLRPCRPRLRTMSCRGWKPEGDVADFIRL